MSFLHKIYLSVVFAVYSVILLHNTTPHLHGKNIVSVENSLLQEWFELLFGPEHQEEVLDKCHLAAFRIQEDQATEHLSLDFSNSSFDLYMPLWTRQNYLDIFPKNHLSFVFSWPSSESLPLCSRYSFNITGRAPPTLI